MFLSQDGNKLVVLASKYQTYSYGNGIMPPICRHAVAALQCLCSHPITLMFTPSSTSMTYQTRLTQYLTETSLSSGSYFNSRMIGNYVYAVVSQPATVYNNVVTLPAVYNGKTETNVTPSSIYYADMVEPSYYHLHQLLWHQHFR